MKHFYSLLIYLVGIFLWLPDPLLAQDLQAIEIMGDGRSSSSGAFNYDYSQTRNQMTIPPEVLNLPAGTEIHAISLQYNYHYRGETSITESMGNLRIALKETSQESSYEHPATFDEEGLQTCYEGSDKLEFNVQEWENQFVSYNFDRPYIYNGGFLVVDLLATTPNPVTNAPGIYTTCHEWESITNLSQRYEDDRPYIYSDKPDLVLGVILPSGQAIPFIPLTYRELIFGHADVGGQSESIEVPIENKGDIPFEVTGLNASCQSFTLIDPKTVGANSTETLHFQFTPTTPGTKEENVILETGGGDIEMKLSGTTYKQTPYNRVIEANNGNLLRQIYNMPQNEREEITELTITGTIIYSNEISELCLLLPNLTKLDLSTATSTISSFSFREGMEKLEQLALPSGIESVNIEITSNLSRLILPMGLETLRTVYDRDNQSYYPLPANLTSIIAFGNNPVDLYSREVLKYIETVYVPENAVQAWTNAYGWSNKQILPITDAILQPEFGGNLVIRDERVFTSESYPTGEVEISIKPDESLTTASAGLTNQAPIQIKSLSMSYKLENRYASNPDGLFSEQGAYSSFINENEGATIQGATYNLKLKPYCWHFISFPFQMNGKSEFISAEGNGSGQFVLRSYDSQARANRGMAEWDDEYGNWQDHTGTIYANRGFIYQTEYPDEYNEGWYYNLSINLTEQQIQTLLKTEAVTIPLDSYTSNTGPVEDNSDNENWNLIGNPYPAFYNIRNIDFGNASILFIWNGQSYTPLSITDDSYSLRPLEAFFVQRQDDQADITFSPEGRSMSAVATDFYSLRSASNSERKLLNLSLGNETYTDKARIVINPSAPMGYDTHNDAIKWMSPNKELPQLYSLGTDGKPYAINERPAGTGRIPLGLHIGQAGSYTLRMAPNDDWQQVYLIDKQENKQVDLCSTTYWFRADQGTINDRFEVYVGTGTPTANSTLGTTGDRVWTEGHTLHIQTEADALITVHTATGMLKYNNRHQAGSTTIHLGEGFYLVRINNTTHKVIIH